MQTGFWKNLFWEGTFKASFERNPSSPQFYSNLFKAVARKVNSALVGTLQFCSAKFIETIYIFFWHMH